MSNDLDEAERCWKAALELEVAGGRDAARAVIPLLIRADLFTCRALKTLLRPSPPAPACPSRSAFGDACELPRGHDLHRAGKVAWTTVEDDEPPEPPRQVMTVAPGDEELARIDLEMGRRVINAAGGLSLGSDDYTAVWRRRALFDAGLAHARAESEGMRGKLVARIAELEWMVGAWIAVVEQAKELAYFLENQPTLPAGSERKLYEDGLRRAVASLRPGRKPEP